LKISAELTVFDGAGCIGGNKIYLKSGDAGVFLDFGLNFGETGRYFEEFLQPRIATHGVHDLLSLGVIPSLNGIYRTDAFIGPDVIEGPDLNVDAVFISHAHADHVGQLGLLRPEIPIYCSHMSAMMIKATQDCGGVGLDGENTCYTPRVIDAEGRERKLKKPLYEAYQRDYRMVDESERHSSVQGYWSDHFVSERTRDSSGYIFEKKPLTMAGGTIGAIQFEAIPVDHSVYGATAYVFNLGGKTLCYTGDFRMHGWRPAVSATFRDRLKEIRPDYLLIEGTNVGSQKGNDTDVQQRASEEDVHLNCLEAVRSAGKKLVIADFGLRNIERLLIFLKIANETNRKLAVTVKDLFFLHAMGNADPEINAALSNPSLIVYEKTKGSELEWEKAMRRLYGERFVTFSAVREAMAEYILAFSFWDIKELLDLKPDKGVYIYSTCEAFSEEMEIDVWRLGNWLARFNLETVGIKFNELGDNPSDCDVEFVTGYHASGHISCRELKDFIATVKPGAVIPIHTEHPEMFSDLVADGTRIIIPEKGRAISLT
jgi:ribonuclease J